MAKSIHFNNSIFYHFSIHFKTSFYHLVLFRLVPSPSELLVAKRSSREGSRLKSAVVRPPANKKLERNWKNVARRIRAINQNNKKVARGKVSASRTRPKITPEQRVINTDRDILDLDEQVDLPDVIERGRLLKKSTLKPATSKPRQELIPDPIPVNSIDTTKRIVRVVKNHHNTSTLGVSVVPKTVSIGIQVGSPCAELSRKKIAPVVVPNPEPPLTGFWTHKVNLPYPPQNPIQHHQPPIHHQHQPVHQQPIHHQTFHHQIQPQFYHQPYEQQPVYQYPQVIVQPPPQVVQYQPHQPFMSRRQRRNNDKRQKYIARHHL